MWKKPAYQSSVGSNWIGAEQIFGAQQAVDGSTESTFPDNATSHADWSCILTDDIGELAWWYIDMQGTHVLNKITIFSRTDDPSLLGTF